MVSRFLDGSDFYHRDKSRRSHLHRRHKHLLGFWRLPISISILHISAVVSQENSAKRRTEWTRCLVSFSETYQGHAARSSHLRQRNLLGAFYLSHELRFALCTAHGPWYSPSFPSEASDGMHRSDLVWTNTESDRSNSRIVSISERSNTGATRDEMISETSKRWHF